MILAACQRYCTEDPPRGWVVEHLGKHLRLEYGSGLTDAERRPGPYPVYGSNGRVGTHAEYLVEGPGILVGRKGSVGEVHFCEGNFWPIDTVYYVRPKNPHNMLFLAYMLEFLALQRLNAATGVPGLTRRDALFMLGAFPAPAEQARIAETLKAADDHIRALEDQIRKAERVKRSLLHTLFIVGMPPSHHEVTEEHGVLFPKGWLLTRLGSLLIGAEYGISASFGEKGAYQILRMENVTDGGVNADSPVYIDLSESDFERYRVRKGDILFNRTNSWELVGRVGAAREDKNAVFASYLVRLKANPQKVNPFFLNHALNSPFVKRRYRRFVTPAVSQANINVRNLCQTWIAVPDARTSNEQDEIVAVMDAVDTAVASLGRQLTAARRVKQSLLQNLLTGRIRLKP